MNRWYTGCAIYTWKTETVQMVCYVVGGEDLFVVITHAVQGHRGTPRTRRVSEVWDICGG